MSDSTFEAVVYDLLVSGDTVSYKAIRSSRDGGTQQDSFTATATFSVSAASTTIRFGMAKLSPGTTLTVNSAQMRVTEIREY